MKQEAQALLGRLEYDRGNYEKALQNLEEIQANTFIPSLRFFVADTKAGKKKGRHFKDGKDDVLDSFLHGASLLLEALYLKVKCLQELGRHSGVISLSQVCCYEPHVYVSTGSLRYSYNKACTSSVYDKSQIET